MDKERLAQRLMATFVVELEGHVQAFEQGLLALERNPTPPQQAEIFAGLLRTAHTLKGAARSVKVELLEAASHRLEEIFSAARSGRLPINRAFFDHVLPIVDAFGEAGRRLAAGEKVLDGLLLELTRPEPVARPGAQEKTVSLPERVHPSAAPAARPTPGGRSETVRVAGQKLDAMLRQSGELLVVRHRAEARAGEAANLQDILAEWRREWRGLEQRVSLLLKETAVADSTGDSDPAAALRRRNLTELSINRCRNGLGRLDRGFQRFVAELGSDHRAIEQTAGPLDATIRRTRMFPFVEACEGMERVVRDLCSGSDKAADLVIEGGDIELDRTVLESIRDPLLHLVRNAVDHGIEPKPARRLRGKPEVGRVVIAAALRGARVEIKVQDDGKGLDLAAISVQLQKSGQPVPDESRELMRSIFLPGLSTAAVVTQVSGRGVGLDVVKTQLAAIRGTVEVEFTAKAGTVFTLDVPLTLTSVRAVMVGVGSETYAIDTASIARVVRIGSEDIRSVGERDVVFIADRPIPVLPLADLLGQPVRASAEKTAALVLRVGEQQAVLLVDLLYGEREIVVRTLGPRLRGIANIGGGTILSDGRIALILNAAELLERAQAMSSRARRTAAPAETVRRRLLVVDDSATIRALEKSILEAAGYDVVVAADGLEAWHLLLETGADLVVSDVEMPRMDGFTLTETIRASRQFRDLPVVLVTAMESETDKARGLAVGANAYRPKSAFDQTDLLATIERIL
jgi:two-component system, chemotaxis family, sensor kinase CheA